MLEKPEIDEPEILRCVQTEYGLPVQAVTFLPLGADQNTAVYRVVITDGTAYFLKLRRGEFDEASVAVPNYLHDLGLQQIIPALPTLNGRLTAAISPYRVILYPFVEGKNGFERDLTDRQWIEFGAALKRFHSTEFPQKITQSIPRENFSSHWRDTVKIYLERVAEEPFQEPVAAEMAAFIRSKKIEIDDLIQRAVQCANKLLQSSGKFIVCHGDIHAWNLLIVDEQIFYMVDWDTLIFAPKERDLMFIGSGLGGNGHTLLEEETLFYQGYGSTQVDPTAMAYYRYERIIEDIAVICDQIFLTDVGGEDRRQHFGYLKSNFLPNHTIDIAYRSDKTK
jgi:spectinomycin phosphotransferase